MALKTIERVFGDSEFETPYLVAADDPDELESELESELEDGANAIWPCGEFSEEALPPAPGGCRRVPHDW